MLRGNPRFIDLTHTLSESSPTWNGSCGFCAEVKKDYDQMFKVQKIKMHAGVGTHMDAPSHRFEGAASIEDIPLEKLIVPLCVIDVSKKSHADYEISPRDIQEFENRYGSIPKNSLVIGFTHWSQFWSESNKYRNMDASGQMHFPAFSKQAASILIERDIAGIGIDTLSPDCLDQEYPVHKLFLGSGRYIIENIADCSLVPRSGAYAIALPIKGKGCTEAPIRLVAVIGNT